MPLQLTSYEIQYTQQPTHRAHQPETKKMWNKQSKFVIKGKGDKLSFFKFQKKSKFKFQCMAK